MVQPDPPCPYCRRKPPDPVWRPFCSERCKLQDLALWADGAYRIPAEPVDDPDESEKEEDSSLF